MSPHLARWPPRMSSEPRTSGSSWSSSRNTRRPLLSVTCTAEAVFEIHQPSVKATQHTESAVYSLLYNVAATVQR